MPGTAVRAFLGSQGLGALPRWIEELPRRPRRAVVVPTAGNPLPSTPWVDEVAEHLAACKVHVEYLDLEGARPADVNRATGRCELVFVTGGHPIFLLEHAQRSGFTRIAGQAAPDGRALVRRARARKIDWIARVLREWDPADVEATGRTAGRLDEAARSVPPRASPEPPARPQHRSYA